MATPLTQKFLTSIPDSGFARAKKLADLALKKNVDGKGNTLARGYEEAIQLLEQYAIKEGNVGIDAQRLVAGYTNSLTKLKVKNSKLATSLGQLKLDEQEIYFVNVGGEREDIIQNVPEIVGNIARSLTTHLAQVDNAIENAEESEESSVELRNYMQELSSRYREMSSLYNDFLNEELSQGEMLDRFGVFVDSDQEDGSINRIGVVPVGNLPPGVSEKDFKRLDSSVSYSGTYIPIYSTFSTSDIGENRARIGGKTWSGTGSMALSYNKKRSAEKGFKNKEGSFDFSTSPLAGSPMRRSGFAKSVVGFNEDGTQVEQLFYTDDVGAIWKVKDKSIFDNDVQAQEKIRKATVLAPSYAKSLLQTDQVKELDIDPMQPQCTPVQQQPMNFTPAFFTPAQQSMTTKTSTPASFFNRVNESNKPEEPAGVSSSPPDIVEQGKKFFQKVGSFFSGK